MSPHDNTQLPKDFREFLLALNEHQVEWVLIGGYAVGAWGYVRATGDLDIFINATQENAQRMRKACLTYGIPDEEITLDMFLVPQLVGIGEEPLRIEILKKLDTVDFSYVYARAEQTTVDGISVRVVGLDDFILLKHAATQGRDKARDSEDLLYLRKLKTTLSKSRKEGGAL